MPSDLIVKTFDYSLVDTEQKGKLIYLAAEIKKHHVAAGETVLLVGELVANAHDVLANHGDGKFHEWIERECSFSRRTANNYLNAFNRFGKDRAIVAQSFEPSAMYLLGSPKVSKKAATEAMKMADKGVAVTAEVAKEIIAKHKANGEEPKPECPVSKGKHQWESDGNGERYCIHCKEDCPSDKKKPAPRRGKAGDEFKKIDEHFDKLFRAIDDLASSRGKEGKFHKRCQVEMDDLGSVLKEWKKAAPEAT